MPERETPAGNHRLVPGAADSPVLLHVPHASTQVNPDARRHIRLTDAALARQLALLTDAHTDTIALRATALSAAKPWLFVNGVSRLVVDPERFPDDREELQAAGMGAVYTRTADGERLRDPDPSHIGHLLATYYRPYAAAMASTVDARLAATGRAVILDVHSYPSRPLPYELHADRPRPAVCLGTDPFHTPAALVDAARAAFADCGDIVENAPFAGCYVPLKHYRREPAVTALMVEIRRDTYLAEPGGAADPAALERLSAALAHLIRAASVGRFLGRG